MQVKGKLARLYYRDRRYQRVVDICKEIIEKLEINPMISKPHFDMGLSLERLMLLDEAKEIYGKALDSLPVDKRAEYRHTALDEKLKKPEETEN
jgi:hypothetical protein